MASDTTIHYTMPKKNLTGHDCFIAGCYGQQGSLVAEFLEQHATQAAAPKAAAAQKAPAQPPAAEEAEPPELHAWLAKFDATALLPDLGALGAKSVEDLTLLDAGDIETLGAKAYEKLKKLDAKKLVVALSALTSTDSDAAGGAPGPGSAADVETRGGSGEGSTANQGVQKNYMGMTAEEDWRQVEQATTVHIISTPWDKTNPIAGEKARATKNFHDNAAAGVYVFNPNSGLRAAASAAGMSEEEQGARWLQLWTEVCKKVQATSGKCFVMAKGTPQSHILEGKAQQGEVNVAEMAQVPIEYVCY